MADEEARADGGRGAGWVIAGASVAMVVFMAMHPTVHSPRSSFVHGALIATMAVLIVGFWVFAERLAMGGTGLLARGGLVAYVLGAVAGMGAAAINGIVVPALIAEYDLGGAGMNESWRALTHFLHTTNWVLAEMMVVGSSVAVVLWSLALLRRGGGWRAIGFAGLVCGVLPVAALAAGRLPMSVHGFGAFVLVQAVWGVAVGVAMVRGKM